MSVTTYDEPCKSVCGASGHEWWGFKSLELKSADPALPSFLAAPAKISKEDPERLQRDAETRQHFCGVI